MNEEMQEILIANLTLDTYRKNNIPPLVVPQGDYGARVIKVKITRHGKSLAVESTAAVSIVAKRSGDGVANAYSGKVNADGSVTVPVTQWMLDLPDDDVVCNVVVSGNGYQYSTTSFLIEPQEKANPSEITPDDPRKDIVTEVLATENARQASEAERQTNESARIAAEEARQSAETQRLTDESTRVENEAERVSSESSRDATFKSWAENIASLPSFDSRISANSDRITNLEAGVPSSLWSVDDTVAHVKDVPDNARPRAIINKIGGMSYSTENLVSMPYYNASQTINGITFNVQPNGSIIANGTASDTAEFHIKYTSANYLTLKIGETYTLSGCPTGGGNSTYCMKLEDSGFSQGVFDYGKGNTFTPRYERYYIKISIYAGTTVSYLLFTPMLNEGDTAKPFSPHFSGVRDTIVTKIESILGVNLWNEQWHAYGISATSGEIYASVVSFSNVNFIPVHEGITYYAYRPQGNALRMFFYGENKNYIGYREMTSDRLTFTAPAGTKFLRFQTVSGFDTVYNNDICINVSDDTINGKYYPYLSESIALPSALQALDGWGQGIPNTEYYNFVDWRPEEGVTEWHQVCAKRAYETGDESLENVITDGSMETVYPLDEEIVTDISNLLTADNLIPVEGGGTIIFENEYGYDVPNTVTYMLKEANA